MSNKIWLKGYRLKYVLVEGPAFSDSKYLSIRHILGNFGLRTSGPSTVMEKREFSNIKAKNTDNG